MTNAQDSPRFNRRDWLRAAAAAGVVAVGGCAASSQQLASEGKAGGSGRRRQLRIAHLTDLHVQPERGAAEGLAACLRHVHALTDRPDVIVTGGDLIMDAYDADRARTELQFDLLRRVFAEHATIPVAHTLGNHDIWGWNKPASKTAGTEKGWGKAWACEALGMAKPYWSHDVNGWHLVHLDSVQHHPKDPSGYIGKLDDEQLEWLRADLAAVKPGARTVVVSHIPILSATVVAGDVDKELRFGAAAWLMHADSPTLRGLFEECGHVRACLSGHMHRIDRVDFRGVRYLCNGAVCGSWWKGPEHEAVEGYALVDCYDDGSVESTYVPFGWAARS
jgi:3',5'-cyclic-AMP phosphodiesterase